MVTKKNPKVDLEKKKSTFFQIGLIVSCSLCWLAFEWKTPKTVATIDRFDTDEVAPYSIDIPSTSLPSKTPPPPPKKEKPAEVIKKNLTAFTTFTVTDIDVEGPDVEDDVEEIFDYTEEATEAVPMNIAAVEFKPRFPGCEHLESEQERFDCFTQSIYKHIKENYRYPKAARNIGIEGKVYVNFVIDATGEVKNVSVRSKTNKLLDDEATRIIKSLPTFIPAKQYNKPVPVHFTIPINFELK